MRKITIILSICIIASMASCGRTANKQAKIEENNMAIVDDIIQDDFYGKWVFRGTLLNQAADTYITITINNFLSENSEGGHYKLKDIKWLRVENVDLVDYRVGYTISGIIDEVEYFNIGSVGEEFEITFYLNNDKNRLAWYFPESGGFFRVKNENETEVLSEEELESINENRKKFNLPPVDKNMGVIK
jgi:hypothetical protein